MPNYESDIYMNDSDYEEESSASALKPEELLSAFSKHKENFHQASTDISSKKIKIFGFNGTIFSEDLNVQPSSYKKPPFILNSEHLQNLASLYHQGTLNEEEILKYLTLEDRQSWHPGMSIAVHSNNATVTHYFILLNSLKNPPSEQLSHILTHHNPEGWNLGMLVAGYANHKHIQTYLSFLETLIDSHVLNQEQVLQILFQKNQQNMNLGMLIAETSEEHPKNVQSYLNFLKKLFNQNVLTADQIFQLLTQKNNKTENLGIIIASHRITEGRSPIVTEAIVQYLDLLQTFIEQKHWNSTQALQLLTQENKDGRNLGMFIACHGYSSRMHPYFTLLTALAEQKCLNSNELLQILSQQNRHGRNLGMVLIDENLERILFLDNIPENEYEIEGKGDEYEEGGPRPVGIGGFPIIKQYLVFLDSLLEKSLLSTAQVSQIFSQQNKHGGRLEECIAVYQTRHADFDGRLEVMQKHFDLLKKSSDNQAQEAENLLALWQDDESAPYEDEFRFGLRILYKTAPCLMRDIQILRLFHDYPDKAESVARAVSSLYKTDPKLLEDGAILASIDMTLSYAKGNEIASTFEGLEKIYPELLQNREALIRLITCKAQHFESLSRAMIFFTFNFFQARDPFRQVDFDNCLQYAEFLAATPHQPWCGIVSTMTGRGFSASKYFDEIIRICKQVTPNTQNKFTQEQIQETAEKITEYLLGEIQAEKQRELDEMQEIEEEYRLALAKIPEEGNSNTGHGTSSLTDNKATLFQPAASSSTDAPVEKQQAATTYLPANEVAGEWMSRFSNAR